MANPKHIICCDWGTSSLRLKLIDSSSGRHIGEYAGAEGIASVHAGWQSDQEKDRISRQDYFLRYLHHQMMKLVHDQKQTVCVDAVIISGMASSSIGMMELPYAPVPFSLGGEQLISHSIKPGEYHPYPVWVLSGLRYNDDVMRGEETQLVGLANAITEFGKEALTCILPGTHSKHVSIQQGRVTAFKTYITGELFEAVSKHTVLGNSVGLADKKAALSPAQITAFIKGVELSRDQQLLSSLFTVRTNGLFQRLDSYDNYYYLSGLLIGAELSELFRQTSGPVLLASSGRLHELYRLASDVLDRNNSVRFLASELAENAAIAGQLKFFYHQLEKKS